VRVPEYVRFIGNGRIGSLRDYVEYGSESKHAAEYPSLQPISI
jgi:hypothetical protein